MKSLAFHLFCLVFLFTESIFAQNELSLQQAVETAIEQSFQLKISRENELLAENNNHLSFAGGLPNINLTFNANANLNRINNPASFLTELNTLGSGVSPGLEVSYMLYNGGRVRLSMDQLGLIRQQSGLATLDALDQLVQTVSRAYFAAVVQQDQLEVTRELLALTRDRISRQEARLEYGQGSSFELLQAREAYLRDSTTFLNQAANVQTAMNALYLAMGLPDFKATMRLTDNLDLTNQVYDESDLLEKMMDYSPTFQNMLLNQEIANLNTQLLKANQLPSISARAGANYNWNTTISGTGSFVDGSERDLGGIQNNTQTVTLGVSVLYPLYDGGLRKRQVENAQIQELISNHNTEQIKLQLRHQLAQTFADFQAQKQVALLAGERVNTARASLDIAKEKFDAGQLSSFDYREVQLNYLNSNQAYLASLFNLKNSELQLLRLAGNLVR